MKFTYLFLILSLFQSCSGDENSTQAAPPRNGEVSSSTVDNPETFERRIYSSINDACNAIGGNYSQEKEACFCPHGLNFIGWDRPRCEVPQITKMDDLEFYYKLSSEKNILGNQIISKIQNIDRNFLQKIQISDLLLPSFNAPDMGKITFLNDNNFPVDDLVNFLDFRIFNLKAKLGLPKYFSRYYSITSTEEGVRVLAPGNFPLNKEFKIPRVSVRNRQLFGKLEILEEIYKKLNENKFSRPLTKSYSELGCLGSCTKEKSIEVDEGKIVWLKTFVGGVKVKNQVFFQPKDEDYYTLTVHLDPLNYPSLIVTTEIKEENNKLVNDISVFTKKLSPLIKDFGYLLIKDMEKERRAVQVSRELNIEAHDNIGGVVLCDTGFTMENASREFLADIFLHPNSSDSHFGWVPNPNGTREKYSGAFSLSDIGIPLVTSNDHAIAMGKNINAIELYGYSNSAILPFSMGNCLETAKKWVPEVRRFGVKTVNLSFNFSMDNNSCKALNYEDVFNYIGKDMLWIFSAGNSFTKLTKETAPMCPQNVAAKLENTLIVGANRQYSNSGKDFVDISVDVMTTSEAAAQISGFSSKLFRKYPNAEVKDIKNILLLSVYEDWRAPESRFGGFIDFHVAQLLAETYFELKQLENLNKGDLLKYKHSIRSKWGELRKDRRRYKDFHL